MAVPSVNATDERFYRDHIRDELPDRVIDAHAHVWYQEDFLPQGAYPKRRSAEWAARMAPDNPAEDLVATYQRLFPGKTVTPVVFGNIDTSTDVVGNNRHVARDAQHRGWPALAVSRPEWSASEFEERVMEGGFSGCKPYLNFAPEHLRADDIEIFDFLPRRQLEVINEHGWVVMLHIARSGRLGDPVNLRDLMEIDRQYPNAQVIVTHIGRAYALEDLGNAMEVLAGSENLLFDFTANTNSEVMEELLRIVDSRRVMFGSDLPIFGFRGRRVVEDGRYVNTIPRGAHGDVSADPTMRETDDSDDMTLMLYEEIAAFLAAARRVGLTRRQRDAVFHDNAQRVFGSVTPNGPAS